MSKYMSQTNRTILFEEINSEMVDRRLDKLLRGEEDKDYDNVLKSLTVTSFEDFMEKFKPVYYECTELVIDPDTGEKFPAFTYKLKKPASGNYEEKDIRLQPFYKAIMNIYENKGISGENDFKFEFKEALDRLYDPEQAMNEARDIRQSLQYHHEEYLKLERAGAPIEDINYHAQQINDLKKLVKKEYISQSQFNMLPLLLQDTKEQIELKTGGRDDDSADYLESIPIKAITFNEKGSPVYQIERSAVSETALPALENKSNVLLLEDKSTSYEVVDSDEETSSVRTILSKTFDAAERKGQNHLVVPGDPSSTMFMKDLFLAVFTGRSKDSDISIEELKSNLKAYESMYRASQQNFAKGVVKLVEKLINIKAFFDNAGGEAELIVSNCSLENLMKPGNIEKFETYIKKAGEIYTGDRIWFAIIPGVWDNDFCSEDGVSKKITIDNYDDDDDENDEKLPVECVPLNTAKRALALLGKSNIVAFFNFKGCDKTTSAKLDKKTVANYKNKLETVDPECKKYAVFAYPNFTILPKRNTTVTIGDDNITLPPLYVDASYVACGLYVASQNLTILKQKGFKVNPSLEQPVRFNFEGKFATTYGNNEISTLSQVFATNMNREKILPWGSELMDEINADGGFGFCFCGNEMHYTYKGQNINQTHAYPLRARTLQKDKVLDENNAPTGEERFRPIFKTMVETYIKKISNGMQRDILKKECKTWCEGTNKANINNIVYSVESAGLNKSEDIQLTPEGITVVYDRDKDEFEVQYNEL